MTDHASISDPKQAPQQHNPQVESTPVSPPPGPVSPTFPRPGAAVALAAASALGGLLLGGVGTAAVGMAVLAGHPGAPSRCVPSDSHVRSAPGGPMFGGPDQYRGGPRRCEEAGPDGSGRGPEEFGGRERGPDQVPGRSPDSTAPQQAPTEPDRLTPGSDGAQLRRLLRQLRHLQRGAGTAPSAPGATGGEFDDLLKLLAQAGVTPRPATTAPTTQPDTGS